MFVLKNARSYGGYENAFGHRKSLNFPNNAIKHLFSECGPLN